MTVRVVLCLLDYAMLFPFRGFYLIILFQVFEQKLKSILFHFMSYEVTMCANFMKFVWMLVVDLTAMRDAKGHSREIYTCVFNANYINLLINIANFIIINVNKITSSL